MSIAVGMGRCKGPNLEFAQNVNKMSKGDLGGTKILTKMSRCQRNVKSQENVSKMPPGHFVIFLTFWGP